MTEDLVRVLRVIEYVGPRSWVEKQVRESIQGERRIGSYGMIRVATVGNYPEMLGVTRDETNKT